MKPLLIRSLTLLSLALSLHASQVPAQAYPVKPVRIVIGLGPGTLDTMARLLARSLGQDLGTSFVVENRQGAGGTIGASVVARAEKDGYTLGMFNSGVVTTAVIQIPDLPYDPLSDFTPLGTLALNPVVFGVAAQSRFRSLDDMIAAARKAPGTVTCGLNGVGTHSDVIIDILSIAAGVPITHVPFSGGSGNIVNAVLGGQVDCYSGVAPSLIGQVRAGKMRILASTSALKAFPDVPTFASRGYPQVTLEVFFGAVGPAGLPRDVSAVLVPAIRRALAAPENAVQLEKMGVDALHEEPAQLMERIRRDLAAVQDVAKKLKAAGG